MSKLSERFIPDKNKSSAEQLNDVFNHIREQLDFLCCSAEYQNALLEKLCDYYSCDSSNQSKNSNN